MVFCVLFLASLLCFSKAQILTEDFDSVIPTGWTEVRNSDPVGTTGWFQGTPAAGGRFDAQSGAANSYAAVDITSGAGRSDLATWLISPEVTSK
jgi:hypothetical protein